MKARTICIKKKETQRERHTGRKIKKLLNYNNNKSVFKKKKNLCCNDDYYHVYDINKNKTAKK